MCRGIAGLVRREFGPSKVPTKAFSLFASLLQMLPKQVVFHPFRGDFTPKSKGNMWKMPSPLLWVGRAAFHPPDSQQPRFRSKAGGRKMGCATAFYQIPQISVTGWPLLMIILSICIAFSSHRSQNTLKRLVKAIIGSRLSWSTLHPRGQPPLCLAQRASSA